MGIQGKICVLLLVGWMAIMLAGCQTAQSTESDSVQESEIAAVEAEMTDMAKEEETVEESLPTWDDYELNGERWMDRDFTVKDDSDIEGQEGKISNIYIYDENEESDEWEEYLLEAPYRSYSGKTEGLLPVAVSTMGGFYVDLSVNPQLQKLVREDRVSYIESHEDYEFYEYFTATDYIQRADSYAYSYLCVGTNDYVGFNYHVGSGTRLTLEDVVQDKDALVTALTEQLSASYGSSLLKPPQILAEELCEANGSGAWNIGYQGLPFYANASFIGGSENNYFMVTVTFAAYPDLFYEECMQVPESYAVSEDLYLRTSFRYDLNEDGTAEEISIFGESSYSGLNRLTIRTGDLEKTVETGNALVGEAVSSRELICHILHLGDGKNFIYVHTSYESNDWNYGIILSVSDSEIIVLNDKVGLGVAHTLLIDPRNIVYAHSDGLIDEQIGTFSTIACAQIGENGQIHREEGIEYYRPHSVRFETTTAFLADQIDRDNADVVLVTQDLVPSKRSLMPFRTDRETFIDFIDDTDGKVYRGVIGEAQWHQGEGMETTINGSLVKIN